MSDTFSRTCRVCNTSFVSTHQNLEFCTSSCLHSFSEAQKALLSSKDSKIEVSPTKNCAGCGTIMPARTTRKLPRTYCSQKCSAKATSAHRELEPVVRPCVHCEADVVVPASSRPEFVRCEKHRILWPKVRLESTKNIKKVKAAEAPFEQYFLRGPWWDHKHRAWTVLLMHSGASSKREMEYARYLLSVKEGNRLSDSVPVVYVDGDRTNVEISNLALG